MVFLKNRDFECETCDKIASETVVTIMRQLQEAMKRLVDENHFVGFNRAYITGYRQCVKDVISLTNVTILVFEDNDDTSQTLDA